MKKYINKLFEWLEYVPKDKYDMYKSFIDANITIDDEIKLCVCEYQTLEAQNKVFVTAYSTHSGKA